MSTRSTDASYPTKTPKTPVALIALALFSGTAARTVLIPMQELMRADLGATDQQVALLQGFAVALPLALVAIPVGRLVDRANRSRLLIVLALLCSVGSAFTAIAHSFTTMFLARMVVGLAVSGSIPAAVSLASDFSNAATRGKTVSVLVLGQVLGSASTFVLVGLLLSHLPALASEFFVAPPMAPWRLVQSAFAAVMLCFAAMLAFLPEPARKEQGRAANRSLRAALGEIWGYRRVLVPLIVGLITIGMADAAADIWAVPVLTRTFHLKPEEFGGWMSLVFLVSGLGGIVAGGQLADFGQRQFGSRGGILFGAAVAAAVSIPAAAFPMLPSVTTFAPLLALLLAAGACAGVVGTAAISVLLPNELRGLATSIVNAIGVIIAFGVAPSLVSATSQLLGHGDDIRLPLTLVGVSTSVIGSLAFWFAMREARAGGIGPAPESQASNSSK